MGCVPECGAACHRLRHSGARRHRCCPTHRRTRPAATLRRDRRGAVRRRSGHRKPRPRRCRSSARSARRARRRHGTCRPLRAVASGPDRAEDPAGFHAVTPSTTPSLIGDDGAARRACLRRTAGHRMVRRHDRPTLDAAEPAGNRGGERRQRSVRRARARADRRDIPGQVATPRGGPVESGPFATASRGRCAPPARHRRRRLPARPW